MAGDKPFKPPVLPKTASEIFKDAIKPPVLPKTASEIFKDAFKPPVLPKTASEIFKDAITPNVLPKSPTEELKKAIARPVLPKTASDIIRESIQASPQEQMRRAIALAETDSERMRKAIQASPQEQMRRAIALAETDSERMRKAIQQTIVNQQSIAEQLQKAANRFANPFEQFRNQMASFAQVAVQPLAGMVKLGEEISTMMTNRYLEPIQQIRDAIAKVPFGEFDKFQKALAEFARQAQEKWTADEKRVFAIFTKLGLVGLESHFTSVEILKVLQLHQKNGKEGVIRYVVRAFKKNGFKLLNQMARGWWTVPYMKSRRKTIRSAISAHKEGRYELSIPALLPLIDGLALEMADADMKRKRKSSYTRDVVTTYHQNGGEVYSECLLQVVNMLVYKDYDLKTVKKPPSSINRHGILHGCVVGYGTELNSYRVILLLDFMVAIYQQRLGKTRTKKLSKRANKSVN